ncbi:DNA/RNA non-specific endonuclease [Deinococcus psychrotolerans]|uniref:DNA/RNA non-specific endonuclease n=1 Tax=Deinococcus psychrotolerans TaxID=2489213 RepID=A0A3G8YC04_9DEIO|nr:CU044_2847 family protein [Deinococcus psychrotolerans]AZI42463.1 DNA/RNA non-specific endonuclease [Deinococcus psychrotolerans]
MSQQRHMAYFTAVNIDGAQSFDYPRKNDMWHFDSRIPAEFQIDNRMYSNEPGAHGFFDRGHLVRRRDPIWGVGDVLKQANNDTFHWTNCSPQYWEFNQSDTLWQGLENFIFANTDHDNLKVTVLTGPVFADDDPLHRQIQIPQQFWKVVAVCDAAETLTTSAYTVSQAPSVKDIPFEALPVGPYSTFQVSISYLEGLTGLDLGETVRAADVFVGEQPKKLDRIADIAPLKPIQPAIQTAQQALSPTADQLGVELENGQILYFELTQADEQQDSQIRQLDHDGGPFLQVGETRQAALKKALPTLTDISQTLQDINQPDELWLQLGLKVTADANIILARLGTEGTLNVTLKWLNTLPDGSKKPPRT